MDLPFLLTHEDWVKLHSPLKTSIKYGFTPEELGHTPEEFLEIKASPQRIPYFFYPTPNSMVPQLGKEVGVQI